MILFSDRGTPDGYRFMHGYSGHTFKWINKDGDFVYVQVHCRVDAGVKVAHAWVPLGCALKLSSRRL